MKKGLIVLFTAFIMSLVLTACNTNEGAREQQRNNFNEVSFGPEDQGIQQKGQNAVDPGAAPGQNRFDPNIHFEGLNPNGPNGMMDAPNMDNEENKAEPDRDQGNAKDERFGQVNGALQEEVVKLTNQAREKNGLKPLKIDGQVAKVAQKKSEDMSANDYFSHTSPTYGTPFDMLKEFGVDYRTAAENIAAGQETADQVVKGWLNSPGHRRNIMNKNLTHIGIGYDQDGNYWTQMFIGKK